MVNLGGIVFESYCKRVCVGGVCREDGSVCVGDVSKKEQVGGDECYEYAFEEYLFL